MNAISQLNAKHTAFVRQVANLVMDGENEDLDDPYDEGFVWENDDCYDTLHSLISEARTLVQRDTP